MRARGSWPPSVFQASSESLCLLSLSYEGGIDPQRRVNSVSTGSPSQPALPAFALHPREQETSSLERQTLALPLEDSSL